MREEFLRIERNTCKHGKQTFEEPAASGRRPSTPVPRQVPGYDGGDMCFSEQNCLLNLLRSSIKLRCHSQLIVLELLSLPIDLLRLSAQESAGSTRPHPTLPPLSAPTLRRPSVARRRLFVREGVVRVAHHVCKHISAHDISDDCESASTTPCPGPTAHPFLHFP